MIKMRGGYTRTAFTIYVEVVFNQNPLKSQPRGWDTLFIRAPSHFIYVLGTQIGTHFNLVCR